MRTAIVYIANRCNQNCVFCLEMDGTWQTFTDPSTREVMREIEGLRARGGDHITFMGGETLFRKDLPQILTHARAQGFTRVGVTTNGTVLGTPGFLHRMVDAGLDFIEFSLHGHTEDLANRIAGTDFTFRRQARALAEIDKIGSLPVIFNVVICHENVNHVTDIARYVLSEFPHIPARFKFKFVSQMGRGGEQVSDRMLRYAAVDAVAVGDYAESRGAAFWFDNFPLCRLGRHAGHSLQLATLACDERYFDYDHRDGKGYLDTHFQQSGRCWPTPCTNCSLRPICCGLENAYDLRQGSGELSPRSDDPLPLLAFALSDLGHDPDTAAERLEALRKEPRPLTCSTGGITAATNDATASAGVDEEAVRVHLERDFAVELQVEPSRPGRPAYARIGNLALSYRSGTDAVYERPGVHELLTAVAEALEPDTAQASVEAAAAAIVAVAAAMGWKVAAGEQGPASPPARPAVDHLRPPLCAGGSA